MGKQSEGPAGASEATPCYAMKKGVMAVAKFKHFIAKEISSSYTAETSASPVQNSTYFIFFGLGLVEISERKS